MQNEKQTLADHLAMAGFWNQEDGDPTANEHSLGLVLDRINERLARGVFLVFYGPDSDQVGHQARLVWGRNQKVLAIGEDLSATIYNAALALPDFLKNHPECAKNCGVTYH